MRMTYSDKNMDRATDERYMRRCLQLARNGFLGAPPNPMVGAVIVCGGRIIGEGYHIRCGGPHAEVNAVNSVRDPGLLRESTVYVSLEPCSHYGRTPPCADMLVSKGVRRVVVGCIDPFAKVQGRGIAKLRAAGIDVTVGVLEAECRELNRRFITFQSLRRPYVTLKWAQSADGYIGGTTGGRTMISTPLTQTNSHRLRAMNQAILVGRTTAATDDPALTTRLWPGANPLRVVMDRRASLPPTLRLFDGEAPTLAVTEAGYPEARTATELFHPDYSLPVIPQLLGELHRRGIQTLLVEGGAATLQGFIDSGLWDEAVVERGAVSLGGGTPAPRVPAGVAWRPASFFGGNFATARNTSHIV